MEKLDAGTVGEDQSPVDDTSVAKLFEEIKVMFQDLPSRIDPMRRPRHPQFHPMMVEELLHLSEDPSDPIGLLLVLSLIRDELPWLHEAGMEVYRAIKRGDSAEIEKAIRFAQRAADFSRHGPFREEPPDKGTYFVTRELPNILERYLEAATEKPKRKLVKLVKLPPHE